MPKLSAQLRLPLITIGVDDVAALVKRGHGAGPFLVISRVCGYALDTRRSAEPGEASVWPTHALRHQLWFLQPAGVRGETLIVSADNGLALDATTAPEGGTHAVLWRPHGEPWQRWRLGRSPDKVGYAIVSAHRGFALETGEDAEPGWAPWLNLRSDADTMAQQWVFAMPHEVVANRRASRTE